MKRLIEKASVVFKDIDCGDRFEVLKTRDGQLTLGGKYSRDLVEFYAKTNDNVLVLSDGILDLSEEEPLKVGDYAKVAQSIGGREGAIVKILGTDIKIHDFRIKDVITGKPYGAFVSQLIKATDEEVAEAKEAKRWAVIGRKPGEFRKGDIALYGGDEYVRITGVTDESVFFFNKARKDAGYFDTDSYAPPKYFELVTPVEARFDR